MNKKEDHDVKKDVKKEEKEEAKEEKKEEEEAKVGEPVGEAEVVAAPLDGQAVGKFMSFPSFFTILLMFYSLSRHRRSIGGKRRGARSQRGSSRDRVRKPGT